MPLLTIFTAPKPFVDSHIAVIQRNAIQSWLHLGAEVEVLLVGDELGMAQVARRIRCIIIDSGHAFPVRLWSGLLPPPGISRAPLLSLDVMLSRHLSVRSYRSNWAISLIGQRWDLDAPGAGFPLAGSSACLMM
jgi:hypothetical protein